MSDASTLVSTPKDPDSVDLRCFLKNKTFWKKRGVEGALDGGTVQAEGRR